jgi:hypothetical protein
MAVLIIDLACKNGPRKKLKSSLFRRAGELKVSPGLEV